MEFGIGLIIAAVCYAIIATRGWGPGKHLLAFAPCAVLALVPNSLLANSTQSWSFPSYIRNTSSSVVLSSSDIRLDLSATHFAQTSEKHDSPRSAVSRRLQSKITHAADRMRPVFRERVTLDHRRNVEFSQAQCINTANTNNFSLSAVPPEIWVYCAGPWNMTLVRTLNSKARSKNIHPADFLDPAQIRSMLGANLSDRDARQVFRDLSQRLRATVPDMYDVFEFSKYVQVGELHRVYAGTALFEEAFDVHQRKKAEKLSELYSSNDVIIHRENTALDLVISTDPEVHVVTTVLSNITIRDLFQSYLLTGALEEQYRPIVDNVPPNFVMVFSDKERRDAQILNVAVFNLLVEAVSLEEAGLELARPFSELLSSATWLYLGSDVRKHVQCNAEPSASATAFYCAESVAVYAPTQDRRETGGEAFQLASPEMLHELYHAFLNPSVSSQSPFVAEILATGRGEKAARTYQASVASLEYSDPEKSEERLQRFLNALVNPTGTVDTSSDAFLDDMKEVKDAIEKQPVTSQDRVQGCRALNYLKEPQWLTAKHVLDLMALDSVLWNEMSTGARHRAYAAAWALGSFGRYGNVKTLFATEDIKVVLDAASARRVDHEAIASSLESVRRLVRDRVQRTWCAEQQQ